MIPFLVADRPISLSIIKGISLREDAQIGILSQAVTTTNRFKELFRNYPRNVDVVYANGQPTDVLIKNRTVKMVDSGIFGKNGCHLEYDELFEEYKNMGAHYGVIIDAMRDTEETIKSARKGIREFRKKERSFELVGVTQGRNLKEYLQCFEKLQSLGYEHIAIGGLLKKRVNTARYVNVRSKDFLEKVLKAIRKTFDPDWLFVLGAFHPSRIDTFREYGVWGSDYKGWIFSYEKKETVLDLIREKKLERAGRVALKDLLVRDVEPLDEQELRFMLTRGCVERRVMDELHGRRLLVLSCSQRKQESGRPMSALKLYDGPAYRTIRKLQREDHFPGDVDVVILSAEHGIIRSNRRISNYDRKMTQERALKLAESSAQKLKAICNEQHYGEVLLWMGKTYLDALRPFKQWRPADCTVKTARGRIGEKLKRLKGWLNG